MKFRSLVALMFVVALPVSAQIFLTAPHRETTAGLLGAILGGALGLTAFPLLITLPWKLIQWRSQKLTTNPQLVSALIFTVTVAMALAGAKIENNVDTNNGTAGEFQFAPGDGCTFSARFPRPPEIKEVYSTDGVMSKEASLYLPDAFLRAECIATSERLAATEATAQNHLREFARRHGLIDVKVSSEIAGDHIIGRARGVKIVSGDWATYDIKLMIGHTSIMSVIAGGISSSYPQPGLSQFLGSIEPLT